MKIQAALVKQLRDKTGLALMLCKKALETSEGDFNEALSFLKKQNKMIKSGSESSKEGVVAVALESNPQEGSDKACILEINSNTDFVARNEKFQKLVKEISDTSINAENLYGLLNSKTSSGELVKDLLTECSNIIGENISISQINRITSKNGRIGYYVHNKLGDNMGKIASIVSLEVETQETEHGETFTKSISSHNEFLSQLKTYADQIAMHIVANKPLALDQNHLDKDFVEKEKEIFVQQAKEKSHKESIIENMIKGKMNRLFEEVVLLDQPFVLDNKINIRNFVEKISNELGKKIKISSFYIMEVGKTVK